MDYDAMMIRELSNALINLQVKYRACTVTDRMKLRPKLEELLAHFSRYQLKLLEEGVITTENDLREMALLKQQIDQAADTQQMLAMIGKTIAFIVTK